ncbi:MAG: hypothetical protein ACXVMS_18150 [Flavisolibacter sp.]
MKDFKEQILMKNGVYYFWFRILVCGDQAKYFVQVEKEAGAPFFFEMKQDRRGEWKVIPPVPDWIRVIEPELILMIQKQ